MRALFIEPFQQSAPPQRSALALVMILQSVMACNYQTIPLLFYRPRFYCQDPSGIVECNELDACMQSPLIYKSDYAFKSIPLDFEFYCDRKKDEATILTLMMLGHLIGAIASTYLSDFGHSKRKVLTMLIINSLVAGIACLVAGFAESPLILGAAMPIWTFSCEMIQNFLNMVPVLYFSTDMSKRAFSLITIAWPVYTICIPTMLYFHLSWRIIVICNVGIPKIIWAIYVWYNFTYLAEFKLEEQQTQVQLLTKDEKKQSQEAGKEVEVHATYKTLYASSHFKNIMLFFYVFGGSYVAAITSVLTLGSISGNIYVNITVLGIIQGTICVIGGYLMQNFSPLSALKVVYFSIGVCYAFYTILTPTFQLLMVISGKLLCDITWIMLYTLIVMIVPSKLMPLIMFTRAFYNLSVSLVLPYIKYFMELLRLNIFIFSAVYEFGSFMALRSIEMKDLSIP